MSVSLIFLKGVFQYFFIVLGGLNMWSQLLKNPDMISRVKASKFRRKFFLTGIDKYMIKQQGLLAIENFAYEIINTKLKRKPVNDGKQTPYRAHPVFIAQHATATCCRKCLFRWHRIPMYRDMTDKEVRFVVRLIMKWVKNQFNNPTD